MKILTQQEVEQVSGAGLIGSFMGLLGFGSAAVTVNNVENMILKATIGWIPVVGNIIVDMLKDPFNSMPTPPAPPVE